MEPKPEPSTQEEGPPRKKHKVQAEQSSSKKDLCSLPYDVLVNILKFLDFKSISVCATLCSTLNNVSKDSSLYREVTLRHNMSKEFLESYVSKISYPKKMCIYYKYDDYNNSEDYTEFNKYVRIALSKCCECLQRLTLESCRSDDILLMISDCVNLKDLTLLRCKGSFQTLPTLTTLTNVHFIMTHFPQKIVSEVVKNNHKLEKLWLGDNTNVNVNEICENLSKFNNNVRDIYLSERKRIRAKYFRMLGRLTELRSLQLVCSRGFDADPEDSLLQIATGCPNLEKLVIYGWKGINDDILIQAFGMLNRLKELDLRSVNITMRGIREACLLLPCLKSLDVARNYRIKKSQLAKLQKEFKEIDIPSE